jgi:hypothetical protein
LLLPDGLNKNSFTAAANWAGRAMIQSWLPPGDMMMRERGMSR